MPRRWRFPRNRRLRCIVGTLVVTLLVLVVLANLNVPSEEDRAAEGAHKRPPEKARQHELCVLVPFRDRLEELQVFAPHLHRFLDAQAITHHLIVLNQNDQFRFNRASLINVGWFEARRLGCDYMCMHDVDLLPLNPLLDYGYPGEGPYHVASPEYHPRYNYTKFIGGILILTMDQYEIVDGMSNKYWGWGLEDDEFYLRLRFAIPVPPTRYANLTEKLRRPANLTTNRKNTFKHNHDKSLRKRDSARIGNQRELSRRRDRISGLKTVRYQVMARIPMSIDGASLTMVNVRLECDLDWTPYCLPSSPQ